MTPSWRAVQWITGHPAHLTRWHAVDRHGRTACGRSTDDAVRYSVVAYRDTVGLVNCQGCRWVTGR